MQYSIVAVLALAGSVLANPAPQAASPTPRQITITTSSTRIVTITSCAPAVTDCPAITTTQTIPITYSYPAKQPGQLYPTGGAGNNGGCPAGAACGLATGGYKFPSPSATGTASGTGYKGPIYTGAAYQVKAAGALAGVGAVAAMLL